jgi:citronellol/citronellal dehydrogenase
MRTEDDWRTPAVVADTVLELLDRDPSAFSGHAVYDEELLRAAGIENFGRYNVTAGDPEPKAARMFDPEYERSLPTARPSPVRGSRTGTARRGGTTPLRPG